MLVLIPSGDSFADHADSRLRYRLPTGLHPLIAGGRPQVLVSRSDSGGMLQVRLTAEWPAMSPDDRPVPFAESRFRLVMRTPGGTAQTGEWRTSAMSGPVLVDRSVSLNPVEAAIARRLGAAASELVEVEVEATVRGFPPVCPWTVYAPGEALAQTLRALLGEDPVPWVEVENAFLGLPLDAFTWRASEPSALPPSEQAKRSLARHAAASLLRSADGLWSLRPDPPPRIALNLAVPVADSRTVGMRWSFSEFLASQSDPSLHLVDVVMPAPHEASEVVVANDVPLAAKGISRIEVEVHTGGPSGRIRHTFVPDAPAAARLPFVRDTFEDLTLRWRAKVTVLTANGPAVLESPFQNAGLSIQIRPSDLGLVPIQLKADSEVFEHVQSVACVVGTRRVDLTSAEPEAWVVGRNPPPDAEVIAAPRGGDPVSLGAFPLDASLLIGAATLGVGEVVPVRISAKPDVWTRALYLAVQVDNGPWRTLERDQFIEWPVRRESRLHAPRLRFRTRHVASQAASAARLMQESDWLEGIGDSIAVEVS